MSGHSKWSRIKRKKEVTDQKRGAIFTKLAGNIKNAARTNKDPSLNPALAEAIARAKAANMPQANIDRILNTDNSATQSVTYEGYGPAGIAFLMTGSTDNTNRTVAEIRAIFKKRGGALGEPGSVVWKFNPVTEIELNYDQANTDNLELALMDAGADDIKIEGKTIVVYCGNENASKVEAAATNNKATIIVSAPTNISKQAQAISSDDKEKIAALTAEFADHPDIENIYTDAK